MQVYSINQNYNPKKTNNTAFGCSGINRIMTKTVYNSSEVISNLVEVYPKANSVAGNLPKEMILRLKNSNKDIKTAITGVKSAFAECSNSLRDTVQRQFDEISVSLFKRDKETYLTAMVLNKNQAAKTIINSMLRNSNTEINYDKIANLHSKNLTKNLRATGLLKSNETASLKFVGEGSYGEVYRINFTDTHNKDILTNKALKVYKSEQKIKTPDKAALSYLFDYVSEMSYEKFGKMINSNIKKLYPNMNADEKKLTEKNIKVIYDYFNSDKNTKIKTVNNLVSKNAYHGVYVEANAALYIKKAAGQPLEKSNFITPYIFDLKNKYALVEYADKNLPKVTKNIDTEVLGLNYNDMHARNIVNGRIIDYGGISVRDKNIVSNTELRRINKLNNKKMGK